MTMLAPHTAAGAGLWSLLARRSRGGAPRRLPKGALLYGPGQRDAGLYVVSEGWVKVTTATRDGRTCLLEIHARGDVLGESCLVTGVRQATAVAMTPTVVTRIPRAVFLETITDNEAYEESLRYLVARLAEQQARITQLVTADSGRRLAATLVQLSRKLGSGEERRRRIEQRITQEELAQLVGATRSRVAHFLREFRNTGLVHAAPRGTLIVDEPGLHAYAEGDRWSSGRPLSPG
ncbi:Crp/Fnr family transcriptional regulator [Streptomyces sp. ST2-7A]|uniref:Crp/Fnr family transcriptional regulator n=1 Tax=Streptomyces sp. ST2-7A TaxID=2907214 RepID=UPI001F1C259B|nr:Crp/Fnr family transcriptional regulator [Streptomyces sp. ST2-7A]MCE7081092.1 Crp/Fnr family transcriptional regulator [Streptomyces sp. ST2-7A]